MAATSIQQGIKLDEQQRQVIDEQVSRFPLFLDTEYNDLLDCRVGYPDEFEYHFDVPGAELDYKFTKTENQTCMIYFPQLVKLLKELNIDEERLQQITKQFQQAINCHSLGSPVGDLIDGINEINQ